MKPDNIIKAFKEQTEVLNTILTQEVTRDHRGMGPPSMASAAAFGEKLILVLSTDGLRACVRQDLTGARSLLNLANQIRGISEKEGTMPLDERLRNASPFYLLASVMLERPELSDTA